MFGDRDVHDASPRVGEDHQDEQEPAGRGRDHEEIRRHDLADVIRQERAPRLRWRLATADHVFRDGGLTDVDPEFQQFAMDPGRPTAGSLRHRPNQRPDVGRHGRSPDAARLFQLQHSRKPRRCQAMTVSGLTMTSAVRHPVQTRDSQTQSKRSALASRTAEAATVAAPAAGAATRGPRAGARRANAPSFVQVRRSDRSTDIIGQKRIRGGAATSTLATRTGFSIPTEARANEYALADVVRVPMREAPVPEPSRSRQRVERVLNLALCWCRAVPCDGSRAWG